MKKIICFFTVSILLFSGVFSIIPSKAFSEEYCAFCDQEVLENQKFYEDDSVYALYTHKPIIPGHCLIVPKRHVERFENLTETEMQHIFQVIKKVDLAAQKSFQTCSYLLLQKNGSEVGQTVPHVHFHYIPRQKGDDSVIKFILKLLIAPLKPPISSEEMQANVDKMEKAID